uniref:Uncharacterized protein n=1 Tax=Ralstonia solanacearum TaxID=305 RepID=A0A0S4WQX0_RALSL|nr:protein of unknown function [Ralstonia solanacearum]
MRMMGVTLDSENSILKIDESLNLNSCTSVFSKYKSWNFVFEIVNLPTEQQWNV